MDPTDEKPEGASKHRKKRPEPVAETIPIPGLRFGDHKFKIESKETRLEIVARLDAEKAKLDHDLNLEKAKLDHDLRKDFTLFRTVIAIVAVAMVACLFLILSNRYPAPIQNAAMALLAAIVSGGVGYATGKSSK